MIESLPLVAMAPSPAIRIARSLTVARIDPINDPRWRVFAENHPLALVFHQPAWIRALAYVFGYEPRFHVLQDLDGNIAAAWPAMLVRSRLTGNRLVCLPFCHRAGPLIDCAEQAQRLVEAVLDDRRRLGARTVEARDWPRNVELPPVIKAAHFYSRHVIDLSRGAEAVWQGLNKDMRYSIRRASRNGVTVRAGNGPEDLDVFYRLYLEQRRRQRLLPQPLAFIRAIYAGLVQAGNGFMVVAEHQGKPIAALLSVGHAVTVIGTHSAAGPDARHLRATPLAMWKSVELACERGYTGYDLGRSDTDSAGLQHFKEEWGAVQEDLPYFYNPKPGGVNAGRPRGLPSAVLGLYARFAPRPVYVKLSEVVYRHLGLKVEGSRFKVQGSRVQGSRFKVQGSRFKVQGTYTSSEFTVCRFNLELFHSPEFEAASIDVDHFRTGGSDSLARE
jgi:CelD/BcsL family acetyltransferase involved in cellulose biosynthesis